VLFLFRHCSNWCGRRVRCWGFGNGQARFELWDHDGDDDWDHDGRDDWDHDDDHYWNDWDHDDDHYWNDHGDDDWRRWRDDVERRRGPS
jgi:hypothetical protein